LTEARKLFDPNFVAKPDPPVKFKEPVEELDISEETR
jgi:hypothetical protein